MRSVVAVAAVLRAIVCLFLAEPAHEQAHAVVVTAWPARSMSCPAAAARHTACDTPPTSSCACLRHATVVPLRVTPHRRTPASDESGAGIHRACIYFQPCTCMSWS